MFFAKFQKHTAKTAIQVKNKHYIFAENLIYIMMSYIAITGQNNAFDEKLY